MMKKLWLTADALAKRLKTGGGSVVELAVNEFLTPNAVDLADVRHVAVRRANGSGVPKVTNEGRRPSFSPPPPEEGLGEGRDAQRREIRPVLGIVLDRPSEIVRSLVDQLYRAGLPLADYTLESCWIRNTRSLCGAVSAGELAGGVIVRPWAAEAVMLANKVRNVRAVQGVSRAAVASAIRQFKANVLVIEHSAATLFEMRSLVTTFAAGRAAAEARSPLLDAVEELERS